MNSGDHSVDHSHLPRPDFIGIGAARSGSTWVFKNLENHPSVWLPRIKELHYFSRSSKYWGPSHLEDGNWTRRLVSRRTPYTKYRSMAFRALGSNILRPSRTKLKWDLKYYLSQPSDEWYLSLFEDGGNKVKGEITPQYSVLDATDVAALRRLLPQVKIIYIMRDPVERAWSLVRYHEKRFKRPLTSLPPNEIAEYLSHEAILAQSDYQAILRTWRSAFPAEQLFLAFFDEIKEHPKQLLGRLARFLDIDALVYEEDYDSHLQVVNASFDEPIPEGLRETLVEQYRPAIKTLSEEEGGYFTRWLKQYG